MKKILKLIFKNKDYKSKEALIEAGNISSFLGMILNLILFIIKIIIGLFTNSVSIISDAFNNLSDTASSLIAFVGYRISVKPADKEHPYGHERAEYLTTLFIGILIIIVGFNLIINSINRFINYSPLVYHEFTLVILILSILVKIFLAIFNNRLGKLVDSKLIISLSKDAVNDVIMTLITIIAVITSRYTSFQVDALGGLIVSVFILKVGIEVIYEASDLLLGKGVNKELKIEILNIVMSNEKILGTHDLILHRYGNHSIFGTIDVEVDALESLVLIHQEIDLLERTILNELNVRISFHIDPRETDGLTLSILKEVKKIIKATNVNIKFHDFRVIKEKEILNIIFDIEVPYELKTNVIELKTKISSQIMSLNQSYRPIITIDYS